MMLPRVDHWERLLAAAVDTARAKPFVWGVHDCPTFAFETRMILTGGEDIAALWRGRYTTALGGEHRLVDAAGGGVRVAGEVKTATCRKQLWDNC